MLSPSRFSPTARKPISIPIATGAAALQDPNSGLLTITIQSFHLRQNGLTILVDSVPGNDKAARERPVFRAHSGRGCNGWPRPASAGDSTSCCARTCTSIMSGWNTRLAMAAGADVPNARYLISRREWDHWQAAGMAASPHRRLHHRQCAAVFAAGQADLVGDEHAVASEISVELAPPYAGQMMVRLGSGPIRRFER